ncbi:uncharacterized protein LOC126679214 [Mercurialis annua]|uniref:uncharacterized protein LOC126679214 n=1 Tax=Mercurialis annua TaxID=3986 RepID=UPI002160BE06|nr:uncharacterized protein LOC126679214 [Mercurialis annua]XP_050230154.1 uncharacterized protein LOC126679214 [Mercurialis annua]XP_050230155.1 uncharacterized protein LOC126679214 [Mercurialis annua]
MRHFRLISPHLSQIRKTLIQNPTTHSTCRSELLIIPKSPNLISEFTSIAEESKPSPNPPAPSDKVKAIVDEISELTLLEISDLTEVLRNKLDIKEMPVMAVMMPGMGFGGVRGGGKGGAGAAAGKAEEKAEKTVFDIKLDGFDAASKIKVIKEVRGFTELGLKEAKDLVEKAPTLLKKGVTKDEAEKIIAKMKEVGAKVSME